MSVTHLVPLGGHEGRTACGLGSLPDGDSASFSTTDCPGCIPAPPSDADPKASRISFLERKRETTKADLLMKFEDGDWHGVQDCGSDLRDIDSELKGLRWA